MIPAFSSADFIAKTDQLLQSIEDHLDQSDIDFDSQLSDGILTITFENRSQIIINRHAVNQEIWVAAKAGGFHYRWNGHAWQDTRNNTLLHNDLAQHIRQQSGEVFNF